MNNIRRKVTLPSLGNVSVNFYGASSLIANLYEEIHEFERQKNINHLGLISTEVDGASHSRYEYLMLQCALTDVLDKLHKGTSSQGSLKVSGNEFLGNGILKSWFMLSNFGHLKNTYGDEKALILYALRRSGFKSRVLSVIRSDSLREWCDEVISGFQYHKFHYVISIYRIYKEQPRRIDNQDRMALLMELLLLDVDKLSYRLNKSKLMQLRGLFDKIRNISIATIDSHYSHAPLSINLISSLVSFDEIEGGVFGRNITSSLVPLRRLLHEELYLNPVALASQRSYEFDALKYLHGLPKNNATYDKLIANACKNGIIKDHVRTLYPFCRMAIHPNIQPATDFYDEFRNITIRVRKGCANVDAYLDVNPYTKMRYADFFVSNDFSESSMPKFLSNISDLIKDQIGYLIENVESDYNVVIDELREVAIRKGVDETLMSDIVSSSDAAIRRREWNVVRKHLFPLYRDLLWSVINYFVKDKYRIELASVDVSYDNYAVSFPELGDWYLKKALSKAIEKEEVVDPDRAHELRMLNNCARRRFSGFKIAGLVRIDIKDMTQPPEKMKATDIDAVLLKISDKSVFLEFFEAKNYRRSRESNAAKELRKYFVPVLNKKGRFRITRVPGYGAKLTLRCDA